MRDIPLLLPRPKRVYVTGEGGTRADLRDPRVTVGTSTVPEPQGYVLALGPDGAEILAHDDAGAFYARQTLAQLAAARDAHGEDEGGLPCLRIEDWPDFPHRGVMLDISRDKVPTMETLLSLVDLLASFKVNQLQLYTEHTFAYRGHEAVWQDGSPMTPDEVRRLDAYCRERFVELVPNQNTFGHMERWLKHEPYRGLAECPDGFEWPWGGRFDGGFSLNPLDPRSIALVEDLFDQLLPNFTSRQVNIGADETFDLGQGKSAEACREKGGGRVYLDFLKKVIEAAQRRGFSPQFWGDIIVKHPELIGELPQGVTAMSWGYEESFDFDEQLAKFAAAGVPYYVCPGTSSWLSVAGRSDNAIANLRNAADSGRRHGAAGFLNTDWGDHGHFQPLPVSYLPLAFGAAVSWNANGAVRVDELLAAADRFVFRDEAGAMARLAYDLGNAYRVTGVPSNNSSPLFNLLRHQQPPKGLTPDALRATDDYLRQVIDRLGDVRIDPRDRPEAALLRAEFRQAAALLRYACTVGHAMLEGRPPRPGDPSLVAEHERLWLARNRPGGLRDSVKKLRQGLRLEPF